ncbi:MAG TPA: hypothetical protein PKW56_10605 [Clostridiales bacterium]|nr:hypothetical protein [Clostridiales bacterium]
MKIIKYILILSAPLAVLSCVPGSDDDFSEIIAGIMPLNVGNKWVYDIKRGSETFTDSSEVIGESPYTVDDISSKWLYQHKNISLTLEELLSDTAQVRLLAYEAGELKYFGIEKRDRTESHFLYGEPLIFDTPVILTGYNSVAEEYYIDSLSLISGDFERVVRDTIVGCFKVRESRDTGSFISDHPSYDLDFFYTGFGIVKCEGIVNGNSYSAKLYKCVIK